MDTSVVIVGAGMSGLTAARVLQQAGISSLVLDKGRVVGGRMATRTIDGARFDHGAQHFAIRSAAVADMVREWERFGVVRRWYRAGNGTERLVGVGGMRRIPEFLASSLQVREAVTVERLEARDGAVTAVAEGGSRVTAAAAVVTPPLPQALTLLGAGGIHVPHRMAEQLNGIRYHACLAVMASLQGPSGFLNGHLSPASGPIAWMADNAHKGTSTKPSVTIHSTPAFAEAHLEDDPRIWADLLVSSARPYLTGVVTAVQGHRWRYAAPTTTLESGYLLLDLPEPIILAGEVFAAARVEGAMLSGLAAAGALIERLG